MSKQAVWAWENGDGEPKGENLAALESFFGGVLLPRKPAGGGVREGGGSSHANMIREALGGPPYDPHGDSELTLPSKVHAHAHRLLAKLAEEGAESHVLDQARRILLEPETYTYSAHGRVALMDEEDIMRDMIGIAEVFFKRLHERKRIAEDVDRASDE